MIEVILGLLIIFSVVIHMQAQNNDLEVQFVWSNVDTPLLSKPNTKSTPIAILKPGSQVNVIKVIKSNELDTLIEKGPFSTGEVVAPMNWVNVRFGKKVGYIKDTYLSDMEFRPNCTLDQFIKEISIQIDTVFNNTQCTTPDRVIFCESGIVYKSVCRELYGEVELVFNGWTIVEALVFLDRFEKISENILNKTKKYYVSTDSGNLYFTDNFNSYTIKEFNNYIQIVITWSC